jgi:hypothetical protein
MEQKDFCDTYDLEFPVFQPGEVCPLSLKELNTLHPEADNRFPELVMIKYEGKILVCNAHYYLRALELNCRQCPLTGLKVSLTYRDFMKIHFGKPHDRPYVLPLK